MGRITLDDTLARRLDEWRAQETKQALAEADAGEFATDAEVAAVRARWSEAGAE